MNTQSYLKWFSAEFIGTMLLASVVGILTQASLGGGMNTLPLQIVYGPALVGLIVGLCVYLFGWASGASFNPAVSIPLYVFKKIGARQLATHLLAQILGALVGFQLITKVVMQPYIKPEGLNIFSWDVAGAEVLGAFVLVLAVASVVYGKVSEKLSGLVIGSALAIGATLSISASGAVLNPALVIGMLSFEPVYLIAPLVGGFLAIGIVHLMTAADTSEKTA